MSSAASVTDAPVAVHQALKAVDAKDAAGFAADFTPDGIFRYANAPSVHGPDAIRESVAQFFGAIQSLDHQVHAIWVQGDMVFCKGEVLYVRHNGTQAGPYPFCNVIRMRGDLIAEWLIYVDSSPLWHA